MENESKITEKKIEFLYEAIRDAQSIIQFTDSKTAVAITAIGAIVIGSYSNLKKIVNHFTEFDIWFHSTFGILFLALVLTIWIVIRIVFPTNNPRENINIPDDVNIKPRFFVSDNNYKSKFNFLFFNSSDLKLKGQFVDYKDEIQGSSDTAIIESLTFELMKVSFIRTLKNDRFKVLVCFILFTTILFVVNTLIFEYQITGIENAIQYTKCP
jgi:uncharacterized membrane protein YhdT